MGYDRTQEFFQAVEELSIGGSNGRRNEARASFSDADRAFNALAGEMGGILHNTSVNLQELGKRKLACVACWVSWIFRAHFMRTVKECYLDLVSVSAAHIRVMCREASGRRRNRQFGTFLTLLTDVHTTCDTLNDLL